MNQLYERIAERVSNLILQNEDAIEHDFTENLKIAEDPSKLVMPITVKIELSRVGKVSCHKEILTWEVKKKEKIETDDEEHDPNQQTFDFDDEGEAEVPEEEASELM